MMEPKRRAQPEHDLQATFMSWVRLHETVEPRLRCLVAVPNGGKRDFLIARRLWHEGVRAGVSDLFLAVASKGYHGMWMETKLPKGTLTERQRDWFRMMTEQGYYCIVWRTIDEAVSAINEYLGTDLRWE